MAAPRALTYEVQGHNRAHGIIRRQFQTPDVDQIYAQLCVGPLLSFGGQWIMGYLLKEVFGSDPVPLSWRHLDFVPVHIRLTL